MVMFWVLLYRFPRFPASRYFSMVDAADLAVFLPDYQESRGAMVEWAYCQRIGKDCAMYLDMKKGE